MVAAAQMTPPTSSRPHPLPVKEEVNRSTADPKPKVVPVLYHTHTTSPRAKGDAAYFTLYPDGKERELCRRKRRTASQEKVTTSTHCQGEYI